MAFLLFWVVFGNNCEFHFHEHVLLWNQAHILTWSPNNLEDFGELNSFLSLNSLVLEVLHHVLHAPELCVQAAPLPQDAVQLSPEVVDVLLKQGLQVLPHGLGALLLEQSPLGVQDLVLLLQEPHLEERR